MIGKVAFVVQRCGLEVNGGAELLCRLIAQQMARRRPTEVLTTCAVDYVTWADHYPPGEERLGELIIRRFPVSRQRDIAAFNRLSDELRPRIGDLPLSEERRWMREQGPYSPALLEYLSAHRRDYDAFIFFTYLYATTYFGLPLVEDKAVLVPTAHDEWPIYFQMWERLYERPRAFVFQTPEEVAFLRERFPNARLNGPVVGVAVDPPPSTDPEGFRTQFGLQRPFILYAGRVDGSKGVGELVEDFLACGLDSVDLVLIGQKVMELPEVPAVRALGFVSEQQKWDAIAACEALVMPSRYESLSIACLEAWSMGKPVLVNASSEVLVGQCRRAQGGLWYSNTEEFCAALETLLRERPIGAALGRQARKYVDANYRWPLIIDAYSAVISGL